jgi:ABC-type bacteriocin/lantibiotic exporter with double-glycine peptidase domain
MLTGAYQSLTGVLSSLTQAGGAATRVIQLLESLPDIDPKAGVHLSKEEIKGELSLDGVKFTYQMRPDNPVSSLSL